MTTTDTEKFYADEQTLTEAQVEAKEKAEELAEEAREDSIWDRLEAIQWTVQMPAELYPENTHTEISPEGLKEFWKLMLESRENDPEDNNSIFRECLWRSLD